MAADKESLYIKRKSYQTRMDDFIGYVSKLKDLKLSSSDIIELQLRTEKVESLCKPYDEVQLLLESNCDIRSHPAVSSSSFESRFYKSLSMAKDLLNKYNKSTNICTDKSTQTSHQNPFQFPAIELPKFDGSYSNWLEFRETFTSLIHSNDAIDEINKFRYLRASVEGSAAVLVQSVNFSASNYAVAWKLICERYDNRIMLTNCHLSSVFNIDAITKESSVALNGMVDKLTKNLRALELLGEPVKKWDILLIHMVTRKLNQKICREWEEYLIKVGEDKDKFGTFDELLQFLRTRADVLETLEMTRN